MVRKLLTVIGALSVLGLLGAAIAGLVLVKDRVRIVVQDDAGDVGPDPLALLRDDVQTLQRDLGELRAELPGSFERLGAALDERAETRHADVKKLAAEVAALKQDLGSRAAEITRLSQRLEVVAGRIDQLATAAPTRPVEPAATPTPAEVPVTEPPPVAVAEPVQPPPSKPKGSFLSFSVPQTKFRFDAEQEYVLVPELSRVGFDAKSTLHDFTGVTSEVEGGFKARLDDPAGAWSGRISCNAAALTTGLEGRDENMREHLDTANHARIEFEIDGFEPVAVDAAAMTCKGTITGRMSIRGKTRAVRMPIELEVDGSRRVVVKGQVPLKMSDYEVTVPSQLGGTITVQDEVSVWVALRARVKVGGGG